MVAKKESVVDQMADDANPPEYPDGAPTLKSYLDLYPRSRRAEFKRKLAGFREWQDKLAAAKDAGVFDDTDAELTAEQQHTRMLAAADADDMFDLMEQALALCAEDSAEYRSWAQTASNDDLSQVFSVFMARSQPGEVSSSTS